MIKELKRGRNHYYFGKSIRFPKRCKEYILIDQNFFSVSHYDELLISRNYHFNQIYHISIKLFIILVFIFSYYFHNCGSGFDLKFIL